MKICPICRKTYTDDGLNFCLEDGSVLALAASDAPETMLMNQPRITAPSSAPVQPAWGNQAKQYSPQPRKSSKTWLWVVGILGLLAIACGGGFVAFFAYFAMIADQNAAVNNSNVRIVQRSPTPLPGSPPNASPSPSPFDSSEAETIDLSTWAKDFSIWGTTEFTDGEFIMSAKEKDYYYVLVASDEYKTDGATVRVTVRNVDNANSRFGYGLIFHSDPTPLTKDYAFLIDSKKKRFRVVRHEPQIEKSIVPWTSSSLINDGSQENILEIRDKGDTVECYINGQMATTFKNTTGPTGGVPGLYSGDGIKAGFKKLEIVN